METADTIRSATKNMKYYCDIIYKAAKEQLDTDCKLTEQFGSSISKMRLDTIGSISATAKQIKLLCENIEGNITNAERFDKQLRTNEDWEKLESENEN